MSTPTHVDEIVNAALKKWPDKPTMTIARSIYAAHPEGFKSLNSCRMSVAYRRGEHRSGGRKGVAVLVSPRSAEQKQAARAFWKIPKSDAHSYKSVTVGEGRVLHLSDIHFPYHNKAALDASLNHGDKVKPDVILLNGDVIDCYQLSRFVRDPRLRSFKNELTLLQEFLAHLRERFPKARIIYKLGNHEERYDIYMRTKAPELLGVPEFEFASVTHAAEHGIEVVGGKRIIKLGKLPVIHGHEYIASIIGPVNAARGMFLRAKGSVLVGHWHHTSEHSERRITGELIGAWSVGCLCDLFPEYAPLNRWNHGLASIEIDSAHNFEVSNHKIIDGRVL